MTVSRQGRAAQRSRTRRDLVNAARELLGAGEVPTVASTAERAGVSRATAYRYFGSNEELVVEAGLEQSVATWLDAGPVIDPDAVPDAVAQLVERVTGNVRDHEARMRLLLRLSLTPDAHGRPTFVRPASRLPLLDTALAPLQEQLAEDELARLRNSLALLMGIDPIVTLRDLCHLDYPEIISTLTWAARTLTAAALRGG